MQNDLNAGFRIASAIRRLSRDSLPIMISLQRDDKKYRRLKVIVLARGANQNLQHGYSFSLDEKDLETDPVEALARALESAVGEDF